jgi:glycoprotein endo-alpha-1,2-mannosidase
MRLLLASVLAALVVPCCARADVRVTAFYYPWYGTLSADGAYLHWSQDGHLPPDDIASSFYPLGGPYSSDATAVLQRQMSEAKQAGIDELAVSWWGRGSTEDRRLPDVIAAAHAEGIAVAAHIEPYDGRSVATMVGDVAYLRTLGVSTVYVYRAFDYPVADWQAAMPALRTGHELLFAQTNLPGAAAAAGFAGVYTYDILVYGGNELPKFCAEAHAVHLLCLPSVGPGFDARRTEHLATIKPRRSGATYDHMWRAAIASHADRVTITSFNEWHEGTQIEPAALPGRHGRYRYLSYDGAYGHHGIDAEFAYLARTRYWSDVFRKTLPSQLKTSASYKASSGTRRN